MDAITSEKWIRKFRILTISLIFSGALNIGLFTALLTTSWHHREPRVAFSKRVLEKPCFLTPTNTALLRQMSLLSFRELCACLTNKELIEEGYTKRDLALALLGSLYHVNIEKALSLSSHQKRMIEWDIDQTITLYPGLTDEQFKAVIQFVYLEKWPLTAEGLFRWIQKSPSPRDPSLEEAFALTPEFYALQILFQKTETPQEASILIRLAAEGNWDLLSALAREQMQMLDLSIDKRRQVLLSYLALRSPTAAELLVKTDFAFTLKKLEDQGILNLLEVLTGEGLEPFCLALLDSPRSDAIWDKAVRRLSKEKGISLPEPFDLSEAIALFHPSASLKASLPEPEKPIAAWTLHTVQEGENLWKIARLHQVKVDEILKVNEIEKDRLYPGMVLRIPTGQ